MKVGPWRAGPERRAWSQGAGQTPRKRDRAGAEPQLPAAPALPGGKMVARRRKRPPRERDDRIPSPPGYTGEPVPPPVLLWPRPVCRVAGEAGPGREPKGVKVEVFSSQAGSGVPGSLRGVPEAKWGVSGLGPEGPPAGVHREPPCEEWHSQYHGEWISDYADSMPDPEALRVEVDTFMEAYDQKIAEVEAPQGGWPSTASPVWLWEGGTPEGGRWRPVLSHSVEARLPFSLLDPGLPGWVTHLVSTWSIVEKEAAPAGPCPPRHPEPQHHAGRRGAARPWGAGLRAVLT
ncbi:uncharacterized protein isoform X2 [Macaca fascicularis]|uniref:uncharacterized protein isoform X2 n=1 Tax=Macaca fascicularis TaxID=9541 RepID=UPI003D15AD94